MIAEIKVFFCNNCFEIYLVPYLEFRVEIDLRRQIIFLCNWWNFLKVLIAETNFFLIINCFFLSWQQSSRLKEITSDLKQMTDGQTCVLKQCQGLMDYCLPVCEAYYSIIEDHVTKSLALYRTLGKMLSVMLAIFTQLALKVRN